jgi:hypothetical protein
MARKPDRLFANELRLENCYTVQRSPGSRFGLDRVGRRSDQTTLRKSRCVGFGRCRVGDNVRDAQGRRRVASSVRTTSTAGAAPCATEPICADLDCRARQQRPAGDGARSMDAVPSREPVLESNTREGGLPGAVDRDGAPGWAAAYPGGRVFARSHAAKCAPLAGQESLISRARC